MHAQTRTTQFDDNPLAKVPAEIAEQLRPYFDVTIDEMVAKIQSNVAEYARPRNSDYLRVTRTAVEQALDAFISRIGDPRPEYSELHEKFREIGAGEAHEGRSLDNLQTAMRVASVVAWRRITAMAEPAALSRHYIELLAEGAFLFLEEIAAAAMEGYGQAQAKAAGEMRRRRGRLINLLLENGPPSMDAIAEVARVAQWRPPATIAAVVLGGHSEGIATPRLPADVLADFNRLDPCLIVPDPDGPGRVEALARALRGWEAAMGPTVELTEATVSLERARDTLALIRAGIITGEGVTRWNDHLMPLLLFTDEALLEAMAQARLAPLEQLRPALRDRMAETLLAWLQSGYNANEVALRLHVHPQTVRYRLRRLEELFGDQLRDPDHRFELELVLRVRSLKATAGGGREAAGLERARR
ncbi:PucR family transcriptional regulator [Salinactinospora qingdaonensis]|uniref:PucR family transcriptional regulator n=1 Tax=Salinactinospora qingdaonensis TaxID=702744 RepID=A0ABP7GGY1_9ACTN